MRRSARSFVGASLFFASVCMTMMGRRSVVATAVVALLLTTSALAFSPIRMETRHQQQTQLAAHYPSEAIARTMAGIMTAGLLLFSSPLPSLADSSRVVGELKGSGLVFKVRWFVGSASDASLSMHHGA